MWSIWNISLALSAKLCYAFEDDPLRIANRFNADGLIASSKYQEDIKSMNGTVHDKSDIYNNWKALETNRCWYIILVRLQLCLINPKINI